MPNLITAKPPAPAVLRASATRVPEAASSPRGNRLLASLPDEDYYRLVPYLTSVQLEAGERLSESGSRQRNVYFPVSSVLSLQCVLEDGTSSEIAAIGREGLFSATLLMDETTASSEVQVQCSGAAYRAAAEHVAREFQRGGAYQRLVLRHMQSLFMQASQISTCNRSHAVEQRLCRWLLGMLERDTGAELLVTQERLGFILGVRRESVTEAAGRLQEAGVIRYRRGRICVLAPHELEDRACSCHAVLKHINERSLDTTGDALPPIASGVRPATIAAIRPAFRGGGGAQALAAAR